MTRATIAALALAGLATAAAAQEATDPQTAYNNHCRTCHSMDEGDDRLGPNLHGILGREAGASEGYGYSDALAASGVTWDEETLDAWIENPDAVINGHRMKPYSGIAEPEVRAAIIAALKEG